jgi:hypothetical protein
MAEKGSQYWRVSCIVVLVVIYLSTGQAVFTTNCMKCICEIEGCRKNVGKCNQDAGSLSCGPYQIKDPYYTDCYSPGRSWQTCTKEMDCSETCVKSYMKRYGKNCTRDRTPTCKDYARIHNGGPTGCRPKTGAFEQNLKAYWDKVKKCCDRIGGC